MLIFRLHVSTLAPHRHICKTVLTKNLLCTSNVGRFTHEYDTFISENVQDLFLYIYVFNLGNSEFSPEYYPPLVSLFFFLQ